MIRQASAWGQFWADLGEQHRIHGCGVFSPLSRHLHLPAVPSWRKAYFSTWFKSNYPHGGPVYFAVEGDTMTDMLRDGLIKAGCYNLRMKLLLLAVLLEEIEYKLARRLRDEEL